MSVERRMEMVFKSTTLQIDQQSAHADRSVVVVSVTADVGNLNELHTPLQTYCLHVWYTLQKRVEWPYSFDSEQMSMAKRFVST